MKRKAHRGVALITAMLITALVASLAAGLAWDSALDVRRTMVLLFHEQGNQVGDVERPTPKTVGVGGEEDDVSEADGRPGGGEDKSKPRTPLSA